MKLKWRNDGAGWIWFDIITSCFVSSFLHSLSLFLSSFLPTQQQSISSRNEKWRKYQGFQTALLERMKWTLYYTGCLLINSVVIDVPCFTFQMRFRIAALESTAGFYQKTPRKYNYITFHKTSHKVFGFKDDLNLFAVYNDVLNLIPTGLSTIRGFCFYF